MIDYKNSLGSQLNLPCQVLLYLIPLRDLDCDLQLEYPNLSRQQFTLRLLEPQKQPLLLWKNGGKIFSFIRLHYCGFSCVAAIQFCTAR